MHNKNITFFINHCESFFLLFNVILCPSDIDPVSVIPDQAQVVMLGDKVEWQCKTKASAAHTVHWMKVRSISSSFPLMSVHGEVARLQEQRASASVCQQRFSFVFFNIPRLRFLKHKHHQS